MIATELLFLTMSAFVASEESKILSLHPFILSLTNADVSESQDPCNESHVSDTNCTISSKLGRTAV